jgi:uncharacterized repeat protein (TIGR01451 family)
MKYITTTGSPPGFLALMFGALLLGLVSQSALAAGTASTTVIGNFAGLSYSVGGTPQGTICSSDVGNSTIDDDGTCVSGFFGAVVTDFAVDNKVDVLVTEGNSTETTVAPGQAVAVTTFTVENQGNTTQDFLLTAANLLNGGGPYVVTGLPSTPYADNFDATGCALAMTSTTGTATFSTTGGDHIDALAADEIATITVTCSIPGGQANGDLAVVYLGATARADDAAATLGAVLVEAANTEDGVEIVFGDDAGSDDIAITGDLDGLRDATHSARDVYLVSTTTLSVLKSILTICDPVTGNVAPHNIPGGMARWTITINNTGGSSASLTTITDILNANTTLDPDLIVATATPADCEYAAGGANAENANGDSVKIVTSVARPMLGSAGGAQVTTSFFTGAADADGVTEAAGTLTVDFTTAFPAGGAPAYTVGELKSGENVTVYFNVGIN